MFVVSIYGVVALIYLIFLVLCILLDIKNNKKKEPVSALKTSTDCNAYKSGSDCGVWEQNENKCYPGDADGSICVKNSTVTYSFIMLFVPLMVGILYTSWYVLQTK